MELSYKRFTELRKSIIDIQDKIIMETNNFKYVKEFEMNIVPLLKEHSFLHEEFNDYVLHGGGIKRIAIEFQDYYGRVERDFIKPCFTDYAFTLIRSNPDEKLSDEAIEVFKTHLNIQYKD
ncbi:hypothetical protein BK126_15415 [Paenibacillus sp. FSL H7-0326]|uniref:hypothetical protein n=1 Tax=Paenibacillus sp. FSL H7-0326 TaxID=1921144 RepID=UPI00096CC7D9|nr:hypothetical protein [Paenibacillus sp. FSL H7-0326]OMC69153.1 hypothetical protein BK126_15415 [Paenibacillus sp. FSL H7-0326]